MNDSGAPESHDESREAVPDARPASPDAAKDLFESLRGPVRANVERFLGPEDGDVEDIVQDTLLATLEYLESDAGFEGNVPALAVVIARNRCRDILRRRKRRPSVALDLVVERLSSPAAAILDEMEAEERRRHLRESLNDLSPRCRYILIRSFVRGRKARDLARRLGFKTLQGFYYRRAACLRRLKNILEKRTFDRPESTG